MISSERFLNWINYAWLFFELNKLWYFFLYVDKYNSTAYCWLWWNTFLNSFVLFFVLRYVDVLIENRRAFPSLSFYISVLTLKHCCYISENTPESTETNANSHPQDKQIHTASVVRNMHLKEGKCEKNVFGFVILSVMNVRWEHQSLACFHLIMLFH